MSPSVTPTTRPVSTADAEPGELHRARMTVAANRNTNERNSRRISYRPGFGVISIRNALFFTIIRKTWSKSVAIFPYMNRRPDHSQIARRKTIGETSDANAVVVVERLVR